MTRNTRLVSALWLFLPAASLFACSALASGPSAVLKPGTYVIDPSHTYAFFKVSDMGLSHVHGRVDVKDGTIRIGEAPGNSRVEITFDTASVDTGSVARDKHLRETAGFFDVAQYPSIVFKSTRVDFGDPGGGELSGNLTLHGVTRPVTLGITHMACLKNPMEKMRETCGFDAATRISRSDFGMNAAPELIGDRVDLEFEVTAYQAAPPSQ